MQDVAGQEGRGAWRRAVLVLIGAALGCTGPSPRTGPPFDEGAVDEVGRHLVWTARDSAEHSALLAMDQRAQERRDLVARYLARTRATIEAFRADVPDVSGNADYDVTRSRGELEEADEARRRLLEEAAPVALELHDNLRLSALYLDELEAAIQAVENREPQREPRAFLTRYEALVNAHNRWAEAARQAAERFNGDLEGTLVRPDEDGAIRALLRSGWPRTLLATCDDALMARLDGGAMARRVREVETRLAEALAGAKPRLGPCVDAAGPMLEAFEACLTEIEEGAGELALQTSRKRFLGRVVEFEAVREEVCGR